MTVHSQMRIAASTTHRARSKILASRLLTLALVLAGLAAPLTILGAPRAACEVEINARVFRLYGLTSEEIQLVEETMKK